MNTSDPAPESLQRVFDCTFSRIRRARETFAPKLSPREVGTIATVSTGIATVVGLPSIGFEELLEFPGGVFGLAFNVDEDEIGAVLLGEYWHLHAGDEVQRTGRVVDVVVGDGLLGRVIDPLGRPLDGNGPVAGSERLPITASPSGRGPGGRPSPVAAASRRFEAVRPGDRSARRRCPRSRTCRWPPRGSPAGTRP